VGRGPGGVGLLRSTVSGRVSLPYSRLPLAMCV
jgi:hypothetical protein